MERILFTAKNQTKRSYRLYISPSTQVSSTLIQIESYSIINQGRSHPIKWMCFFHCRLVLKLHIRSPLDKKQEIAKRGHVMKKKSSMMKNIIKNVILCLLRTVEKYVGKICAVSTCSKQNCFWL